MVFPKITRNDVAKFPGMPGTATSQEKILSIAAKYGIQNSEIQQATTRTVYDSLNNTGATSYNFFEGCGTRAFPLTNMTKNSLEVGELLIIESISLAVLTAAALPVVSAFTSLEADNASWMAGQITITANNQVIVKPLSLDQAMSTTNPYSNIAAQSYLHFDTKLALLPQQPFTVYFQTPYVTAAATKYLRCTIRGTGIIFKPRNGS
jgi:hypothetical protein